jgi:riboflavin kinase/FMN adenylyltransferase
MLVFHFDGDLASMTADSFVADLLCRHIGAAGVVTGEDFSFGAQRGGNVQVLREVGSANGMTARAVGPVKVDGQTVSSSRVRDLLKAGDCEGAAALLTRPFAIRGEVIHGDMGTYLRPRYGIYAVSGRVVATGEPLQGAANLGIRPTFDPPKELLEPFLFDFAGDLYGQQIEVELRHFLRPEARFNDMPTLVAQMERDCLAAREALSAGPP